MIWQRNYRVEGKKKEGYNPKKGKGKFRVNGKIYPRASKGYNPSLGGGNLPPQGRVKKRVITQKSYPPKGG